MQPSEKVALTAVSGQDTGANKCQRDARQSRKAVGSAAERGEREGGVAATRSFLAFWHQKSEATRSHGWYRAKANC